MALMDVRYKIVRNGNGKGRRWELFDLENEQGETTDDAGIESVLLVVQEGAAEGSLGSGSLRDFVCIVPCKHACQGALARSVWAHDRMHLTLLYGKVDALEDFVALDACM